MRLNGLALAMWCLAGSAQGAQDVLQAALDCKPATKPLTYDCMIDLSRNGAPLAGAKLTVGADMPSMPMAHNVRPVKARAEAQAGRYSARLELEMPGEWAVKLRVDAPVRDQLVIRRFFGDVCTSR